MENQSALLMALILSVFSLAIIDTRLGQQQHTSQLNAELYRLLGHRDRHGDWSKETKAQIRRQVMHMAQSPHGAELLLKHLGLRIHPQHIRERERRFTSPPFPSDDLIVAKALTTHQPKHMTSQLYASFTDQPTSALARLDRGCAIAIYLNGTYGYTLGQYLVLQEALSPRSRITTEQALLVLQGFRLLD